METGRSTTLSVMMMMMMMMMTLMMMTKIEECAGYSSVIDLTHPLSSSSIYWPGVPSFNRTRILSGVNENNIWLEVGVFSSGEHGGTHIDAPRHFNPTGYDLKDLPLELTIAEGVMIDVRNEARNDSDYALTVNKVQDWEKQHGRIPDRAAVIINTGWTSRWSDPKIFFNSNTTSDPTTFHFPTVSKEAARWLVLNRNLKMLGLDVPGPDRPRDNTFPVHGYLLARNVVILENMMIPETLPPSGFRVHASPIRIEGGTGTQTRVYAMLHGRNEAVSHKNSFNLINCVFICFMSLFWNKFQ